MCWPGSTWRARRPIARWRRAAFAPRSRAYRCTGTTRRAIAGRGSTCSTIGDRESAMKAVVCEAFGGPEVLALREVPDPPPPGPGEVQVRIAAPRDPYAPTPTLAGI